MNLVPIEASSNAAILWSVGGPVVRRIFASRLPDTAAAAAVAAAAAAAGMRSWPPKSFGGPSPGTTPPRPPESTPGETQNQTVFR
jgi:hypothetical protein